jgi:hypothetical protein
VCLLLILSNKLDLNQETRFTILVITLVPSSSQTCCTSLELTARKENPYDIRVEYLPECLIMVNDVILIVIVPNIAVLYGQIR